MPKAGGFEHQLMLAEYSKVRMEIDRLSKLPLAQLPRDDEIAALVNRSSVLRLEMEAQGFAPAVLIGPPRGNSGQRVCQEAGQLRAVRYERAALNLRGHVVAAWSAMVGVARRELP